MKALFTSDLHGLRQGYLHFSEILQKENYDIGIISGDLTSPILQDQLDYIRNEIKILKNNDGKKRKYNDNNSEYIRIAYKEQEKELKKILYESGKQILFIMGNDDGINGFEWCSENSTINVNQKKFKFKTEVFVGYQYTNPFVGGLFEKTENEQMIDFKILCQVVDQETVLITHGPAYGRFDNDNENRSLGSKSLRWLIDKKRPKMHLFGHLHGAFGINGIYINGSYPDRKQFIGIDFDSGKAEIID